MTYQTQLAKHLHGYSTAFFRNNPKQDYAAPTLSLMHQIKNIYSNRGRSWERRVELAHKLMQEVDPTKIDRSILVYLHGVNTIASSHKGIVTGKVKNAQIVKGTLDSLTKDVAKTYSSRAENEWNPDYTISSQTSYRRDNVVPISTARKDRKDSESAPASHKSTTDESDYTRPIRVIAGGSDANPDSVAQLPETPRPSFWRHPIAWYRSRRPASPKDAVTGQDDDGEALPQELPEGERAERPRDYSSGLRRGLVAGGIGVALTALVLGYGWWNTSNIMDRELKNQQATAQSYKSSYETANRKLGYFKPLSESLQVQVKALDDKYKKDIGEKDEEIKKLQEEKSTLESRLKAVKAPRVTKKADTARPVIAKKTISYISPPELLNKELAKRSLATSREAKKAYWDGMMFDNCFNPNDPKWSYKGTPQHEMIILKQLRQDPNTLEHNAAIAMRMDRGYALARGEKLEAVWPFASCEPKVARVETPIVSQFLGTPPAQAQLVRKVEKAEVCSRGDLTAQVQAP